MRVRANKGAADYKYLHKLDVDILELSWIGLY